MQSDPAGDGVVAFDQQIIGHFDVGPAGVGPMADVTTGEFYPSMASPGSSALDSPPD